MTSSIAIFLCLCLCFISNFTTAIIFRHSNTSSTSSTDAVKGNTTEAQLTLQNSNWANTITNEDATEYTASGYACQQYSKEILNDERTTWNDTNKFPWMAALGYLDRAYRIFYSCNGIVISDTFVLTTAACVSGNLQLVFVRLGVYARRDYYIKDIIRHPYYDPSTKKNDIALLRLQETIIFSRSIRPACLQLDVKAEDPSSTLLESGWVRHTNRSEDMLKAELRVMPLWKCNETILEYNEDRNLPILRHGISKNQLCAYDQNYMGDICRILSGGALQTFSSESLLPNILGIASFEFSSLGFGGGCSKELPGIFTRISNYVPWIESNVWPFHRRKVNRNGSNANKTNSVDDSSLLSAAINGQEEIVSQLIQNGADVNQMQDGETLLHAVANAGQEKIARLLIHNGADFTIKNKDEKLASELAMEKGLSQLARVLQENVAQKACDIYSNIPVITTRILGGEEVESDTEFPWMAALGYVDSNLKVTFNCGGTLISDKFILTAAHCVKTNNPPVVVRLGQLNLNNDNNDKIAENHHIKEIFRHPDYSLTLKTNDIALIELENRIFLSETTRPACLQTYLGDENINVDLTIAGWGIVSSKYRNRSDTLLKATLRTVPLAECSTILMDQAQKKNWTPFRNGTLQSHYCAADPNHKSDTCQGDSGGPLQIIRKYFDLSTVVGVVSTGVPCGTTLPGIYTRVASYIDWIESLVWPDGEIATPKINQASLYS